MSYLKQIRNTYTYLKEDKIAVSPNLYTDKKTFLRLRQDQLNIKYYCCLLHYFALQNSDTYYELKSTLYTDSGDIEKHKILMKRFTRFIEEELKAKGIFVIENDSNGNLHYHAYLVLPRRNIDQDLRAYRKAFQERWEYLCDKLMIKYQKKTMYILLTSFFFIYRVCFKSLSIFFVISLSKYLLLILRVCT